MKISKRSLFSIIALVLTMSMTAFGTVAYMTDRDQVVNTFTVGNIDIIVDEKNVDLDVAPDGDTVPERDQANEYKLLPGMVYEKDPTITVLQGSEACYVRFRLSINMAKELWEMMADHGVEVTNEADFLKQLVDIDVDHWAYMTCYESTNGSGAVEFEFRYMLPGAADAVKVNAAEAEQKLPALFEHFTVPSYLTKEDVAVLHGLQVIAYGDVIQTAAFANADEAWAAFDDQIFGKSTQEQSVAEAQTEPDNAEPTNE